jgi:hypothetical protein
MGWVRGTPGAGTWPALGELPCLWLGRARVGGSTSPMRGSARRSAKNQLRRSARVTGLETGGRSRRAWRARAARAARSSAPARLRSVPPTSARLSPVPGESFPAASPLRSSRSERMEGTSPGDQGRRPPQAAGRAEPAPDSAPEGPQGPRGQGLPKAAAQRRAASLTLGGWLRKRGGRQPERSEGRDAAGGGLIGAERRAPEALEGRAAGSL